MDAGSLSRQRAVIKFLFFAPMLWTFPGNLLLWILAARNSPMLLCYLGARGCHFAICLSLQNLLSLRLLTTMAFTSGNSKALPRTICKWIALRQHQLCNGGNLHFFLPAPLVLHCSYTFRLTPLMHLQAGPVPQRLSSPPKAQGMYHNAILQFQGPLRSRPPTRPTRVLRRWYHTATTTIIDDVDDGFAHAALTQPAHANGSRVLALSRGPRKNLLLLDAASLVNGAVVTIARLTTGSARLATCPSPKFFLDSSDGDTFSQFLLSDGANIIYDVSEQKWDSWKLPYPESAFVFNATLEQSFLMTRQVCFSPDGMLLACLNERGVYVFSRDPRSTSVLPSKDSTAETKYSPAQSSVSEVRWHLVQEPRDDMSESTHTPVAIAFLGRILTIAYHPRDSCGRRLSLSLHKFA